MAGGCLAVDAGLGLLYGPISILILQELYISYRLRIGGPNNGSLTAVLGTTDSGVFFTVLVLSALFGALCGTLIGFLSGVISGLVVVATFRFTMKPLPHVSSHQRLTGAISAFPSSLLALILLSVIDIPRALSYLGSQWIALGWVVVTAIPVLMVFGAAWLVSNRVITWVVDQGQLI